MTVRYIQKGSTINAGWTQMIAVSADGTNWSCINKDTYQAGFYPMNVNTTAPNSYPGVKNGYHVVVRRADGYGEVLRFNPVDILNQATWQAGTASVNAALAAKDINDWLA